MPRRARASGSIERMFCPLKSTSPPSMEYPGWPMSAYESVDLPDPFGPITACTSPLLMERVTRLSIHLPSTLARRSRISKSAHSVSLLLHFVCAVGRGLPQPCGPLDRRPQQALVHLLLVLARQRGAAGHVLDRAVAVADREATVGQLDDLGHMPVLGRKLSQLTDASVEVETGQPRRVLGLDARRAPLEELLELLLRQELDKVSRDLAVRVRKLLRRGGRQRGVIFPPAAPVRLRVHHGHAVGDQHLEVMESALLRNLEVGGDLAERGLAAALQEREHNLTAGIHRNECYEFFNLGVEKTCCVRCA